jgi:hypothetical protein
LIWLDLGFNNFGGVVTINSISIIGGTANYVDTKLSVTLTSPSPITISVGDVTLRVVYNGYDIGPAIIKNLVVKNGANTYDADFQLTPTADPQQQVVLASVLSGYLMHQTFQMQVKGTSDSTSVDSLKEGFAGISLATSLTGIEPTLVAYCAIYDLTTCPDGANLCMVTQITIQNSIDTTFSIDSIDASVLYLPIDDPTVTAPAVIGTTQWKFDSPFDIPARAQVNSPNVTITVNADNINALLDALAFLDAPPYGVYMDIQQTAVITVGDDRSFHGVLQYSQNHVWISMIPYLQANGWNTTGYGILPNTTTASVLSANVSSSIASSSLAVSTASAPMSTAIASVPTTTTTTTVDITTATPVVTLSTTDTTTTTTTTDGNTTTTTPTTDLSSPTTTAADATPTD